jgi:DNA repair protein RadD
MNVELRDYQQRTIDDLYQWFKVNPKGHPCLVLPTGSGKSHIVAALCKDALQSWPETQILMLTHQKELIEQNAEKMLQHWEDAPLGIYSAGIGKKQLGEPITFAGIQSLKNRIDEMGYVDLVIVDECHLISHKEEGGYRNLLGRLIEINPKIRIIGLTATPFRLGHGLITEGDALFDALIEPTSIEELIHKGYLSPLRSKFTRHRLNTDGVHKRGGEFVEKELQLAVDNQQLNASIVTEVIERAGERRSWLFFCTGIDHATHIRDDLRAAGVAAETVNGKTPKKERTQLLADFKAGKIKALTNANVLTTGFDAPNIDLIALLRPTMSPTLYIQMAGRGFRVKDHTDHCLVLDFAGVIATHGPVTNVRPPTKAGEGEGEAPTKVCEECGEILHISVKICPVCAFEFPAAEERPAVVHKLRNDDIMGDDGIELEVADWVWDVHTGKSSGKRMLRVRYYGGLSDPTVTEYLTVHHGGWAGQKAMRTFADIARRSGMDEVRTMESLDDAAEAMGEATPPTTIDYKQSGRFYSVIGRHWL